MSPGSVDLAFSNKKTGENYYTQDEILAIPGAKRRWGSISMVERDPAVTFDQDYAESSTGKRDPFFEEGRNQ